MNNTKKVVLDTNFLMVPYKERIDIFQEIERLIPEDYMLFTFTGVAEELKKIRESRESRGSDKTAAKIALQFIEKKDIRVLESQMKVDEAIIDFAKENKGDAVICTNDRRLKRRLRGLHVGIICMRGRSRLDLT